MKITEFFKEANGQFSSARLFGFLVVFATIIDWMNAVFTKGIWTPEWQTIGMVLGVLGFKFAQKITEEKPSVTNQQVNNEVDNIVPKG